MSTITASNPTTAPVPTITREDQIRRLQALHNRYTNYEIAITRGSERYLVCYSGAKSRDGIMRAIRAESRAALLVAFTGSESIHLDKKAANGGMMGEWRIAFTGRTERQAIQEGELAHFTATVSPVSFAEPAKSIPAGVADMAGVVPAFALVSAVATLATMGRLFS